MTGALTPRGWGLVLTAVVAWLLSRAFGVTEIAIATVALLALIGLALAVTRMSSTRLTVDRRISPTHLHNGERAAVELRVKNRGRWPTATVQVDEQAPRQLAPGARFLVEPLTSGETIRLRYAIDGRQRGRYLIGPAQVALRDPFGIARRYQQIGGVDEVVVYPRVVGLPPGPTLAGHLGAGADGRPRPGLTGDEVANVRDYVRGDDLRKVHWRSTAHRGKLMVRHDENRQRPQAVLVLDTRPEVHPASGRASTFEEAVSAAASITFHLNSRGFRVTLVDQPMARAPQPVPWEVTLERLATIQTHAADLPALWGQLERGVAGDGSVILVSPPPDPDDLRAMVRAGRSFGARVAVLVDDQSVRARRRPVEDVERALRVAGWLVTVLRPGDPLPARWRELAAQRVGMPGGRAAL